MMLAPCGLDCDTCPQRPNDCDGCHAEGVHLWDAECGIRVCCNRKRGLSDCSLCDAFPCQLIVDFENDKYAHHTEAVRTLRELRESRGDELMGAGGAA